MTYLQIRARWSPLPVAKYSPVGLGATEITTHPIHVRKWVMEVVWQNGTATKGACLMLVRGGHTGVLMPLKHELSVAREGIPELYASVLRSAENPSTVLRKGDTQDKVLEAIR